MTESDNTSLFTSEYLVQHLFEKQAALNPFKIAVSSGGTSLTYQELDHQSNQLANYLISLGAIPGNFIGICTNRTVEMVVSVLGVLKAGCCYLPLDPSFPDGRISFMYEDSGARVLISQKSLKEKFSQFHDTPVVLTDSDKFRISRYSIVKPDLNISSQSLAYLIYTSGSTGKPKGVKVHHQAVVNFLNSMSVRPGLSAEDRLLAVTTLSFDISVLEVFLPISFGAELIIADTKDISDGRKLPWLLDMYDITVMQATPATWNILLGSGWKGKKNLKALCGGEAIRPALVRDLLPGVDSLWNMYGPTETTVWSTCKKLSGSEPPILVGTPIDNTTIYILDQNNTELPYGETGEVCIGGMGVTKGYLNQPELTAEKFIPFTNDEIIFKTGDMGRFMPDGNLELFGRIDNQIKLRGFRIEPGEIESLLSSLDNVKEAVVKVHKFDENDERLVAFLNVDTNYDLSRDEIVGSLSKHLPGYMVPSFFQASDGFPRLPNGKINRKALLLKIDEPDEKKDIDSDPLTETQKRIKNIWEEILKIRNIDSSADFYDLGGNSLLVIRILNKIREELGVVLSLKDFISHPTIIQSGKFIDSQIQFAVEGIELAHLTETTNLPLSVNQKRIWLISKLQPGLLSYIIPYTCKLYGPLDRNIFQKSLDALFLRHKIVFSVIKDAGGEPYCEIVPSKAEISFADYSALPDNERSKRADEIINEDSLKAFDLQNGPLYRLHLIKTGTDEFYFHLSIHHIIFDDWSWSVFVNDLATIYSSMLSGHEINLRKIEFQQYDYAQWEKNSAGLKDGNELNEFWKKNLKGASEVLNFPYDFQRRDVPSGRGSYEPVRLSKELSEKLTRISKEEGSSLFTTLLSAFGIQMQKYSGDDDLNIGLPVAYRPHSALENIFGMFVNTVVIRLKYEKDLTFRDIIHLTSEAALNAVAHQELSFENIVKIVNPERSGNINPLFQVSFVWQHGPNIPVKLEGISSERISEKERAAPFDITFYLWENEETVEGEIEYSTDVLKHETILRLKNSFLNLINTLLENPDTYVQSLSIISGEDKKIIERLNETHTAYPKDRTIVGLFEDQVLLYPNKTAVVFKKNSLTYKQLNEKANQLAYKLRSLGVRRDTPVGILADKSLELITGILGILKAGGAYLPIDPEYPVHRTGFIMRESGCSILITENKFMEVPVEGVVKLDLNSPGTYYTEKENIESVNSPLDLAYYMYTSGTTGVPKGSMIRHYSVVRLVRNVNYMELRSDDRILYTSAIVFDVTTFEIWGALLNGMTLYVVEKETILDASALGKELLENKITILHLTSALFTQLAEARTDIFSGLKYLLVGGDVLSVPHINKVRKDNPGLKVINCYGPSENTTYSTTYLIDKSYDQSIPVGKPVSNSKVYIFDKNLNYQPIGVFGELYVGGDGLSKGYLNRDELNKTSFINHPLFPGEMLYKTGDFGRWLQDGNIEFHGRIDNQLKIRGFRVELEEIESVINEIEGVIETVVKPVKVEDGDYRLIAFLNVPEKFITGAKEIRTHVKNKLPSYMVPSAFRFMKGFPITINGKTDKKALIFNINELDRKDEQDINDFTPAERKIYKIWCEALNTEGILLKDNFFDIGGNSLLTIRIINKFREELGYELTFRDIISNPTIYQLAILTDDHVKSSSTTVDLIHLGGSINLPLTLNQKRLWLISQLQPDILSYIISFTYKFTGSLNYDIFQKSLDKLFHRHHIIFCVIKEENGEPYCDIVPSDVKISFIDYSGFPDKERSEKVDEILNADSLKGFDLENGPLYRLYLIKTGSTEYYFRFSIHHIIFDAWSWSILVKDLSEIYNSLLEGKKEGLDELEFQQYDYAEWEKSTEGLKDEDKSKEFWRENLSGSSTMLNFPYDYQRREKPTGRGRYETIELSSELSEKLRKLSKAENSSLFAAILSAFAIQLQKYSGEDDINIGLPVAFRPHSKLENIFGMFVNTVVVRLKYAKELTIRKIIHQTNEAALNAIAHQELPFETIVGIVNPVRSSTANPLFQVGFVWQHNLDIPINLDGVRSEKIEGKERPSIFDITMYLWENGDKIEGEIEYNLDILKTDTIIRLRDNFISLVESVAGNPDQTLSEISIISESDKDRLDEFNRTEVEIPDYLIQNFFENQVKKTPLKSAVICGERSLTYQELDNLSNQMARHLISLGVTNGDIVGICLERSVEMIISVFGVLKAGCCYLPMDLSDPDDKISYMYEDSGAKVLISQSSLKKKFNQFPDAHILLIESDISTISKYSISKPDLNISPQSLAYIIYTSGSTGKPKGVKVHHLAVVNFLNSMAREPGISSEDKLLAITTLSFDISVLELFLPLSFGARIIIAGNEDIFDGQKLSDLLDQNDITLMQATPATWNILLASGWNGKKNLKALCGGEAILPGLVKDLLPKVESLWDMYGPTETTVWSTCNKLTDYEPPILVGAPIDNTSVYILDKNNNQLPIGVQGEVCIGGLGVSKGYHNRPELTAEKFIPFENGQIIYKTGDLGRFLADGNIELFGRSDNQIKLRGFRIEPGEIESHLSGLPGVKEAVVKIQKFDEGDGRLVAFINAESEFRLTKEEITRTLSKNLPAYMIPSFYKTTDGFPRLPNGKINRQELTYRVEETEEKPDTNFDFQNETRKKLVDIWKSVLKTGSISPDKNFFEAGGNSLLAIRVINKIRKSFGIALTFKELLFHDTIYKLVNLIENQVRNSAKEIKLVHLARTTRLPLTINQKRLWLISKLQPDMPSYVISHTYRFYGSLNYDIFLKSINLLFRRHHIVFSVIKEANGEPYCDILQSEADISIIDFSRFAEDEKLEKVKDLVGTDSRRVFDLQNGPLYRIYLIKTGVDECVFHISIHHIIFDGWSWSVLVRDLNEIYNSLLTGKEIDLRIIEFQQYDYAEWEECSSASKNDDELVEFWKENLKGASTILNFPYDFQRKVKPSGKGGYKNIKFSSELSVKLRNISNAEGSSLFATMLSAFGILMQRYSGENDINIGLPVAYRPHSELENIFGMFVNTIVVRLRFSNEVTFRDIIRQTSETALNAIAHQDLTFEKVVKIVNPERSSKGNPLFQVSFAWQNNLDEQLKLDGIRSEKITDKEGTTPFDLILFLWEDKDIIEGEFGYSCDLLKHNTILQLRTNFLNLVYKLVENPDTIIESLPMISEEDKMMIDRINETHTDYPKDKTIVQLFEDQTDLYPNKTAVCCKEHSFTYKQLNERTNQLARTLRESGVRAKTPVAILAEKSLDMIVGILGILKSGGVYVPLDPEYPGQRLNFIMVDSGCKILLTQEKFMKVSIDGVTEINLNSQASYSNDKSNIEGINRITDLAYIMYTSGSTGIPKGSMIAQKGVVRLVRDINYLNLTSDDRILMTGAIVFDATTFEIWGALLNGGTLYIAEKETILNPKTLGNELAENDITILWLTSALFTQIAESRSDIFGKLKYLLSGGDVLSAPHINKVRKDNPGLKVINCYGPTENTTFSTTYLIEEDFSSNIPIGKPISNSTTYIFDKSMNYQPIGIIGELYVGGDGLSIGYINRDDLNARSFIEHPQKPGVRLYKTGDFARWLPDGNIEFHGRIDNQLKIRGFRIELEEIESVISEIEGVIETVIIPIKLEERDYRLVAFLNVSESFGMESKDITTRIKEMLPPYMVPAAYKLMHEFPKTVNGKTDRKALIFDLNEFKSKGIEENIIKSPAENIIYEIWCEALNTNDISLNDNFFDIGGNSLLAISVFSKIESAFKVDLGLRVFFDSPRIRDLAEAAGIAMQKGVKQKSNKKSTVEGNRIIEGEI
jgi:amino acid adenylation domain-containing protein